MAHQVADGFEFNTKGLHDGMRGVSFEPVIRGILSIALTLQFALGNKLA